MTLCHEVWSEQIMKLLLCFILCMGSVIMADAQDASNVAMPPGITIVKFNWARKFFPFTPRGGEVSPFDASQDSSALQSSSIGRPGPLSNPFPPGGSPSYFYLYTMKIRNDGAMGIKAVVWEHIFSDPVSKSELARRRLTAFKKIEVNREESLRAKLSSPPSNVVSAEGLEHDNRSPFVERVQIKCILYRDGTFWEHPEAKGGECDVLRHHDKLSGRSSNRD
jgi:hypothetical protein